VPEPSPRIEDRRFLTGQGRFVADLNRPQQLHAIVVRSDHAHATINGIDTEAALEVPGVVAVHTAADLIADGIAPLPCAFPGDALEFMAEVPRHALADGRARHVGHPLALVLAESHAAAMDGAEAVMIDAEPLPAVVDGARALAADAPLIWEEAPGNVAFRFEMGDGAATEAAFAGARHVVELDIVNNRVSGAPLEPRAAIAEYDAAADLMTLTCTVQGVHTVRGQMARVFGCAPDRIRVIAPDVGGGFGQKNFLYPEYVLAAWAAWRHGRPVKWVAERIEDASAGTHGRNITTRGRLALDAEGNLLALDAELTADIGAYLSGGAPGPSTKAAPTAMGGVYAIPLIHMRTTGVFTNTGPVDAYRGAGKPEANFMIERLIEVAARRCGFDAMALRLKNAITETPYRSAQGLTIDGGRFRANIEDAVRLTDRAGFAARRQATAAAGRLRGLGFGCFLETARGAPQEGAEVRFAADGIIELAIGTDSIGQGHETAFAEIAARHLGLAREDFRVIQRDTALTRTGFGHGGARSMHMGGGALVGALEAMLATAGGIAAELLQAAADDVSFADGRFTAGASSQSVDLMAVSAEAGPGGLDTFHMVEDAPFTFPNGCHAVEVEVDPETGTIEILRYLAVDDYGTLIDRQRTEGQVLGGIAQGLGQALGEHMVYDQDSGQLMSATLMDHVVPRAIHLPAVEFHLEGVPTAANPLGVKGAGQAGCIAAPQALVHAVLDALSPLGVDHLDMPLTTETVWRAIQRAKAA